MQAKCSECGEVKEVEPTWWRKYVCEECTIKREMRDEMSQE